MSTVAQPLAPDTLPRAAGPRVVLSGSYRRDPQGLRAAYDLLCAAGCEILSPPSVDFVDEIDGFVVTVDEARDSPAAIEARHIAALREADLVWLHVPGGYIGPSAALEIGIAHSLDIPVYASTRPSDTNIAQFVTEAGSPHAAATDNRRGGVRAPAAALRDLQHYYGRVSDERGFMHESPQDTMLLLMEEMGELARSLRKSVGLARAEPARDDPADELADVQLYLLHLANVIGVDLASAVVAKEKLNHRRYGPVAA
jgi:NTP pyrophosphatase (non-canonical NTP hydrolase)